MKINIIARHSATGIPMQFSTDVIGTMEFKKRKFPLVKFRNNISVIEPITGLKVSCLEKSVNAAILSATKRMTKNWKLYLQKIKNETNINPEWK